MTMRAIQHVELSSATKSITFTGIPGNFTDLLVLYSVRSDRAGNIDDPVNITLNGSGSNYSSRTVFGSGSGISSQSYGSSVMFGGFMPAASTTANTFGSGSALITDYTLATAKVASIDFVAENNATTSYQNFTASIWSDNSVVTSVTVTCQVANFVAGSSATLYGILRGSDGITTVS